MSRLTSYRRDPRDRALYPPPDPSGSNASKVVDITGLLVNPRRACAARVTVVVPCVCVSVCPGLASATHATTRPSRHTYGLSIVLATE